MVLGTVVPFRYEGTALDARHNIGDHCLGFGPTRGVSQLDLAHIAVLGVPQNVDDGKVKEVGFRGRRLRVRFTRFTSMCATAGTRSSAPRNAGPAVPYPLRTTTS